MYLEKMKNIILISLSILLSSCASEFIIEDLKGADADYINKINQAPLSFEVDAAHAEQTWSRGNSLVV